MSSNEPVVNVTEILGTGAIKEDVIPKSFTYFTN